ncbi:acylphosphatase [Butyrivibrio sp. MC2013]|uniref:acylphosphatase n=1 Tax=Butyrivibrio sp. MC2013 TaxID=1280686 RepID=UPI00040FA2E7|nr:acylphosphatase [Butyrivibrio sp. MC2013]
MKIREHIVFKGDVQGVGFRYTASHLAGRLGLTGYVRNEWDGSVTAEVQGPREAIDSFLTDIQNGRFINIYNMDISPMPVDEEERSFKVLY